MQDGRRLAVAGGRFGALVLAVVTGWIAIASAGGVHAVGAELVGAPAVAATSTRPASPARPVPPVRTARPPNPLPSWRSRARAVSRELVRPRIDLRRTARRGAVVRSTPLLVHD